MGTKGGFARGASLVARSWFRNAEAEECGKSLGWGGAALCLALAAAMVAFPLTLSRYREARSLAEPARWSGLGAAFLEAAAKGGDFRVEKGRFLPDPAAPRELAAQDWRILLDGGGVWSAVPPGKVLRFGRERITASDGATKSLIDAPETVLEGISGADLRALAANRPAFTLFVKAFLSTAASAGVPAAILSASFLMVLQAGLFVVALGFLLSLSGLRIADSEPSARRGVGFAASARTVAALATGAGLLASVVGLAVPNVGSLFAWLVFAMALGIRTIIVYMGRFRKKPIP